MCAVAHGGLMAEGAGSVADKHSKIRSGFERLADLPGEPAQHIQARRLWLRLLRDQRATELEEDHPRTSVRITCPAPAAARAGALAAALSGPPRGTR